MNDKIEFENNTVMNNTYYSIFGLKTATIAIFTAVLVFTGKRADAQQTIIYSQYYDQPILLNPAFAGSKQQYNTFLLFRNQMVGIPNSPTTQFFNLDGPIGDNMGIGVNMVNDQTDILGRTQAAVSYRYSIQINQQSDLSFGINGGVGFNRIDFNRVQADDMSDPALLTTNHNEIAPQFNAGIVYRYDKLTAGISSQNITQQYASFAEQSNFRNLEQKFIRHFIGHVGYEFPLNENWKFEPILLGRLMHGGQLQFDVNAFAKYNDRLWGGLTYREGTSVNVSFGANIVSSFNMGYTYEYYVGDIQPFTAGSHEFQLSYLFGKDSKPANYSPPGAPSKYDRLAEQNREQAEQIDQLNFQIEELQKELKKKKQSDGTSEKIEREIEELKRELKSLKERGGASYSEPDSTPDSEGGSDSVEPDEDLDDYDYFDDRDDDDPDKRAYEQLKKELQKNRSRLNNQQRELDRLRRELESYKEEVDAFKKEYEALSRESGTESGSDQNGEEESKQSDDYLRDVRNAKTDDTENYDYHVVLGAYKPLEAARRYQDLLKTEKGLETKIVQSDDGSFYFVTTKQTNDLDAALDELDTNYGESFKINGNPWVYMKEK